MITEKNISGKANMEIEFCLMRQNTSNTRLSHLKSSGALVYIIEKMLALMCKCLQIEY